MSTSSNGVPQHLPEKALRDSYEPLTAELRRLHITVSRSFLQKLDAAVGAARHRDEATARRPGDAPSRRRAGDAAAPAPAKHIPASVAKAVRERDGNRCQFKLHDGTICGSTVRLEIDHVTPRAMKGPPTVANLRLLCREHNLLAARRIFGDSWMAQFGSTPSRTEHDARVAVRSTAARSVGKSAWRPAGELPSSSRPGEDRRSR